VAKMEFTKMHGAGNDFIMVEDRTGSLELDSSMIKKMCDRHTGIGADGLIVIGSSDRADFRMRYYNSDGGEAELCGNGARCTALFAYSKGIASAKMSFETAVGVLDAEVKRDKVSISIADVVDMETGIELEGLGLSLSFGVCGVPHAMLISDDPDSTSYENFLELGRKVRYHRRFAPGGTNFNLVSVLDRHTIRYRTYERGVEDETLACGTGAVTIAALCNRMGLVDPPVKCLTSGGDTLEVSFCIENDRAVNCTLTGPAVIVFDGYLETENFK